MPTISNPKTFKHGDQAVTGVVSVSYQDTAGVTADQSDDTTVDVRTTSGFVTGTVVLNDPVQAAVLDRITTAASITFVATDSAAVAKTFTIAAAKTGGVSGSIGLNSASNCSVPFIGTTVAIT